jgi:two-component system NtrC family sensor kinase
MPESSAREGMADSARAAGCGAMRVSEGARLSQAILRCANRHLGKLEFLREVSKVLMEYCACDAIEVRLSDRDLHYRWEATRRPRAGSRFERVQWSVGPDGQVIPAEPTDSDLERLCRCVAGQALGALGPFLTGNRSFWTGDTWQPLVLQPEVERGSTQERLCVGGHYRSLVVARFVVDDQTVGLLHVKNEARDSFSRPEVEFCEEVAQALGLAVADRRAQAALRERIKELTCLYGIAQVAEQPDLPLDAMLQRIVELLPPGWHYPENAAARIILDGRSFTTSGFRHSTHQQTADIVIDRRRRGLVEVVYLEEHPEFAVGVFLPEEKKLIDAVAREVAVIAERKEADEETTRLQQQLIHADRLATIGQLAAGVAHELNEPLGSILGFGQLAMKCPDLPGQAAHDTEKIVTAALYAREIIKKLMVFARQVPARKIQVDLNQVVEDGLYFLEARCAKAGITVIRRLNADLPEITADPAQLKQVLVNLVVNAVQAMPDGGSLTVRTGAGESCVYLGVEDTGTGMTAEVREQAFIPFFTTKDVSEGTGLGLAVVHGIVTSHGGSISVASEVGQGTRFEIRLPVNQSIEAEEAAPDGARG